MKDDAVPAFWQGLGLPGLFDVHTHFLPERMLRKVWAHFDAGGPLVGQPWPIRYRGSDDERVGHLRAMGVRRFTALAYAHRPDMAADLNAWTLGFAARTPGVRAERDVLPRAGSPAASSTPRSPAVPGSSRCTCRSARYDPNDPLLEPVWGRLAETGTPVVVHAGSGPVANGYTGPGPFGEVLRRHPALVAVIAHFGAPEYEGFLDLADRFANVMLDTTMVFTTFFPGFPPALLPRVEELGLAGRVLLGSDYPNIPHPYAHQLESLQRLGFGDDWLRAVCWGNAAGMMER